MGSIKIAPSVLSADMANLKGELDKIAGADYVHLDVMDGHFTGNLTFGVDILKAVKRSTNHLGWLYCTAALETKLFCGNGGKVFLLDAHFLTTALIMPAARLLPRRFVSSTVS